MKQSNNPDNKEGTMENQSALNKNSSMQDDNNISSHPSKDYLNTSEKEVIGKEKYCISFFNNCTDVIAKQEELSFEEILSYFNKVFTKPFTCKKNLGAMVCGSFRDNKRSAENLISRSILTFDLDDYEEDFDSLKNEIETSLGNYTYIYYTTSSSILIKPRARILLFIDRDVDRDSYGKLGRTIAAKLFSSKLLRAISDESSFTPSQLMYLPNKVNDEFRRGKNVKELIKVDDYIAAREEVKKEDDEAKELIVWSNNLPLPNVTREIVIETLGKYDCSETDYKEWLKVAQALHHQFEGSDEGLEIFTNWSLTDTRYTREHIITVCREKYKSIKGGEPKPVTFASVIKLANIKKDKENEYNDSNYELREDGVYYEIVIKQKGGIKNRFWKKLCGYLKPVGIIRDGDNKNWAKVCDFTNKDNVKSKIFVNDEDVTDPTALLKLLFKNGLEVPEVNEIYKGQSTSNKLLAQYINSCNPTKRFTGVDKVGWHGNCYLLPFVDDARNSYLVQDTEQEESKEREEYILQSNSANPRKLVRQGTLQGWQDSIGKLANGNNLLMFSIATAIAAPLFSRFGEEGCCFHFSGSSSIGKTTTLYVASSVWGMGKPSSFRTTDNAAESLCKNSNDGLLLMDELAEIDPNSLEKLTYLFGNGTGKGRSRRNGEAQAITTFRILGLSTGEIGLQAKLNEKGKNTTAGQSVRFIEIPADSGKGQGIFDTLHHFENGRDLSDSLRKECQNCGVVIDEWMQYISSNFNDLQKAIIFASKTWLAKKLPPSSDSQVQRVAKKFALIAAIGETATVGGILSFEKGAISEACKVLFETWLEQRGNNGSHELNDIIKRLKKLIQEGISSRFLDADGVDEKKNIQKLAGYKKHEDDSLYQIKNFFIHTDTFKEEVLGGRNHRIFGPQLVKLGYLIPDSNGGSTRLESVKYIKKRIRYYVIPAEKIGEVENEEIKNY